MYEKFFDFNEKPFNLTPDPKFLYLTANHREALAAMLYGIQERRGFISIVGEVGTGKTTLLRSLLSSVDITTETVLIFNTNVTFEQLLKNIMWDLDLSNNNESKPELIQILNQFLLEKLSSGQNVALIIDEAQNLSTSVLEELRMLSNLETSKEKLLQIVLVGQPELNTKLNLPNLRQLKQRIGINYFLTPLNHEEQMQYIIHRLTVARCNDDHIFSKKSLELISKHSKGIPRIINILCDNALLSAYGKGRKRIDIDILSEVISDYERNDYPRNEKDELHMSPPKENKKLLTKLRLAFSFCAVIVIALLILEVSSPGRVFNTFGQFARSVYADLSIAWKKIEGNFKDFKNNNTYQSMVNSSKPMMENTIIDNSGINLQENAIDDDQSIIDQHFPSNHIPQSLTNEFMVSKSSQNYKTIVSDNNNYQSMLDSSESVIKNGVLDNSAMNKKKIFADDESTFEQQLLSKPSHSHKTIVAKKGDMVSSLVLKEYGLINDTIFDVVKRANPEIEDLDQIDIGSKINLPLLNFDSFIVEISKGVFSIHIASFDSYKKVKQYLETTENSELTIMLFPIKISGNRPWYRITMGNFSTRKKAIEAASSMQSRLLALNFNN